MSAAEAGLQQDLREIGVLAWLCGLNPTRWVVWLPDQDLKFRRVKGYDAKEMIRKFKLHGKIYSSELRAGPGCPR